MAAAKEIKSFEFKVTDTDESSDIGIIEGYAAAFGNVDFGADQIERGAFTKTIKDLNGHWPVLLDHDPTRPAGLNVEASEDAKGLKIRSELLLTQPEVRHRYELAKKFHEKGVKMGLSIGYIPIKYEFKDNSGSKQGPVQIRVLREIAVKEHSLVMFPMNDRARTTRAKSAIDLLSALEALQAQGFDLSKIRKALQDDPTENPVEHVEEAAKNTSDPQLLQSMESLIRDLRSW